MKIECSRCFGQPKLNKPKECNNINLLGSITFNWGFRKGVKCKVWKSGETVYVLQRDWFSPCISFEEAISHGIIKPEQHRKKFIYNDNFGGVILRSEAVISFQMPDLTAFILDTRFDLVKEFALMLGEDWTDLSDLYRWEDFFEDILKLLISTQKTREEERYAK